LAGNVTHNHKKLEHLSLPAVDMANGLLMDRAILYVIWPSTSQQLREVNKLLFAYVILFK